MDKGRDHHDFALVLLYSFVRAVTGWCWIATSKGFYGGILPLRTVDVQLDVNNRLSTLSGMSLGRVQRMMLHKHYETTEINVEEVQRLLEGAEDTVTQI